MRRGKDMTRSRVLVVFVLTAACFGMAAGVVVAASGTFVGKAILKPGGTYPDASGKATIWEYPRHSEVDFHGRHFPGGKNRPVVIWLWKDRQAAYWGGAFRRGDLDRFGLSAVVPGSRRVSHRHARVAKRVVVTTMSKARARRLSDEAKRHRWRRAESPKGTRIVKGPVRT
jgi:hypothetical protein